MTLTPLTKWVGNKFDTTAAFELRKIYEHFKETHQTLVCPFAGMLGEAFSLNPQYLIANDANPTLVGLHKYVALGGRVSSYSSLATEDNYYEVRARFNELRTVKNDFFSSRVVTDLVWLIKACHAGLYRENKKGEFNTPYDKTAVNKGLKGKSVFIDDKHWEQVALFYNQMQALFYSQDFGFFLENLKLKSDALVYIDPPYLDTFSSYTGKFDYSEQMRLIDVCNGMVEDGHVVALSNSWSEDLVKTLQEYNYTVKKVYRKNRITRNSKDRENKASELFALKYKG